MNPRLHIEFPGAVSLVSCSSLSGGSVVDDDGDVLLLLDDLASVVSALGWRIYAWCILPDSCTFVAETPNGDLGRGMRCFRSVYTRHANARHQRLGKMFRSSFTSVVLDPEAWLLRVCRHVLLLPVKQGFVQAPGDWPWSSYRATTGPSLLPDAAFNAVALLPWFGATRQEAVRVFCDYVRPRAADDDPLPHVAAPGLLGSEAFADQVAHHLAPHASDPLVAAALLLLSRPSLARIFGPESANERSQLPMRVAAAARLGYSTVQIARQVGVHPATIARYLRTAPQTPPGHPPRAPKRSP